MDREIAPADRSRAGAPVRLEHVAVDDHLTLTEQPHVAHRPKRAADQALDLLGSARGLAVLHLAADAFGRAARQHRVLSRDPALAAAPHPARDVLVDRGGAEHLRASEGHQAGARRHRGEVALEADGPQLVGLAAVRSGRGHGRILAAGTMGGGTRQAGGQVTAPAVSSSGPRSRRPSRRKVSTSPDDSQRCAAGPPSADRASAEPSRRREHLEGGLVGRVDEHDLAAHRIDDRSGQERVVGAAEQQRVDLGVAHGREERSARTAT